jgi:hypothetical protein
MCIIGTNTCCYCELVAGMSGICRAYAYGSVKGTGSRCNAADISGRQTHVAEISRGLPLIFALPSRAKAIVATDVLHEIPIAGRILAAAPLSSFACGLPYARGKGRRHQRQSCEEGEGRPACHAFPPAATPDASLPSKRGRSADAPRRCFWAEPSSGGRCGRIPEDWDGRTAQRIAAQREGFLTCYGRKQ